MEMAILYRKTIGGMRNAKTTAGKEEEEEKSTYHFELHINSVFSLAAFKLLDCPYYVMIREQRSCAPAGCLHFALGDVFRERNVELDIVTRERLRVLRLDLHGERAHRASNGENREHPEGQRHAIGESVLDELKFAVRGNEVHLALLFIFAEADALMEGEGVELDSWTSGLRLAHLKLVIDTNSAFWHATELRIHLHGSIHLGVEHLTFLRKQCRNLFVRVEEELISLVLDVVRSPRNI